MGNRSTVLDGLDVQACRLQRRDGAFSSAARPDDSDVHFLHSELDRLFGGLLRGALTGKRCALPATFKAAGSRARPAQRVTLGVRDGHRGVVEGRINVCDSNCDVAPDFSLLCFPHVVLAPNSRRSPRARTNRLNVDP